ncbi:hypothetical protein Gocc_2476 [Gaiella occulta]|uniref:Pyrrolo-quinoline quinone repeat domain-containing protein n=1 Tax=Gaiella occulta TaxID=1002870 RepID=A0A7M2YUU4_9ACTN|nr:PQQ-binding-like beta-propeller repeat protein [Gaiella occulta]RDI73912.1 hypothetical protein Gocc_2476 [Gaiella occulta]
MLRALILVALALLAAGGSAAAPASGLRQLAVVTLEGEDRVAFVDLARGRVLRRLAVAPGPHNLDATGDGRIVALTSPPSGRVTILDGRRLRVLRVVSGFGSPHDVKLSPDGRTAYVLEEARGTLAVLDTGTGRVLRRLPVGMGAHDVAVGDLAWVTHGARDVPLTLLSLSPRPRRPAPNGTLAAGGAAHDIDRAPDTADVFVTFWESGVVTRIRTGGRIGRVLWRRRVGTLTHHLAFDPYSGRRLWVTDRAGRVLLLSADTGRTLRSFTGCPGPHHVAVLSSRAAVVACNASGTLAVFDAARGRVRSLPVGQGPHDLAVVQVP